MKISLLLPAICLGIFLLFPDCKKDSGATGPQLSAKIYVANEDGETISVISAATNEVIRTIDLHDPSGNMMMVHNVQASPDGKTIWATVNPMDSGSIDEVIVIDPLTDHVIAHVNIGQEMHLAHVVLDSYGQYAYVTATEGEAIFRINAHTYAVDRTYPLGGNHQPHGMRYSNGKLYVSNLVSGTLSIIDVSSGSITEIPVGGMAVQSAVTRDGKFAFSSIYDIKSVVRYDIATGATVTVPLPSSSQGPIQLYPSPDGSKLFICDQGLLLSRPASDKVFVMDIASATIVNTITVGNAAHGVVVSRDGKRAYVTNSGDNTVSVIDTETQTVIATIPVGANPNGIAYWTNYGGQP